MKSLNISLLMLFLFLITSCFKEDEKILPHDPGDVNTITIEMTNNYRYQSWFDLGTGEVVRTGLKKSWDLSFDASPQGWLILLNSSNFMLAARSGMADIAVPLDTAGLDWRFDASSGNPDSLSFSGWVNFSEGDSVKIYSNEVFVIDRGYDEAGNLRGMRKVVFEEVSDSIYRFRFAHLDGTGVTEMVIRKDSEVNYVCFTFDEGGRQIDIEPESQSWDLLFSQYTTLLYTNEGDPYPYLLTGVLSNPAGVEVAQDTVFNFGDIDFDVAQGLLYSKALDEIGYDWKDVVGDVSSGSVTYVIIEGLNYIVRDPEGYYYKLRFTGFYNNSGEKGYPTFEYQRL
ncbi:MAG TPA: HmuY family protein [Bacteroidales bacterium]|nr:HmuY family protein [Bacteroidales bacterium]HPI85540.1 HmuY family protein [Bacteroidales bacterium]HPM91572.1 HmuY family protein [Bacteroidales bacterium]